WSLSSIALAMGSVIQCGVLNQALGLTLPSLVGLKSLNWLEQVLLKKEADQQGWVEALVTLE
ncbi:hypothetical protein, partial [Serratia marcescens]|uniref:hypothetical protein n=1 Tax=Serratia marcescens TaxID=615 RepID=UPI001953F24D